MHQVDFKWTWQDVGRLTFPRYRALCRIWRSGPEEPESTIEEFYAETMG